MKNTSNRFISLTFVNPEDKIVPCEDSDDLVDIIDVAVYLTNNK